jgi:hypothetical protein
MADYGPTELALNRHVVTQSWAPPYKPAVQPMPPTWARAMADSRNDAAGFAMAAAGARGHVVTSPAHAGTSRSPRLLGGAQYTGRETGIALGSLGNGGIRGAAGAAQRGAPVSADAFAASVGLNPRSTQAGPFNAFAAAAAHATMYAGGASQFGGSPLPSRGAGGGGAGFLVGGARRRLADLDDNDDDYDDRVNANRGRVVPGAGGNAAVARRKTRAERAQAREEYRKQHEAGGGAGGNGAGYQSGGEVDDGCIAALGDDDEMRAERLRFAPGAAAEDGTARSAHASMMHQRRGRTMRTPPPAPGQGFDSFGNAVSPFQPPGLRTPVFDATSGMPGPVARHHRRHHHHLLRMLGGAAAGVPAGAAAGVQLFAPHEIPAAESESVKRRRVAHFDPSSWMFGDETVEDLMRRHFMRDAADASGGAAATPGVAAGSQVAARLAGAAAAAGGTPVGGTPGVSRTSSSVVAGSAAPAVPSILKRPK